MTPEDFLARLRAAAPHETVGAPAKPDRLARHRLRAAAGGGDNGIYISDPYR